MDSTTAFWLGLIFAAPLSLAVNLATPTIQRLLGRLSASRKASNAKKEAKLEATAQELAASPELLPAYIGRALLQALRSGVYTLIFILLSIGMGVVNEIRSTDDASHDASDAPSLVFRVIGSLCLVVAMYEISKLSASIYKASRVATRFRTIRLEGDSELPPAPAQRSPVPLDGDRTT